MRITLDTLENGLLKSVHVSENQFYTVAHNTLSLNALGIPTLKIPLNRCRSAHDQVTTFGIIEHFFSNIVGGGKMPP